MAQDFLIVSKNILPDYLEKVITARRMMDSGEVLTITEAVKRVGISRNTYYKYKDYVFQPDEALDSRKASITLILGHKTGVLSSVLSEISALNANIVTISQATPVALRATVLVVLDITNMKGSIDELMEHLLKIPDVLHAHLDALE